jgi:hypothetical protein
LVSAWCVARGLIACIPSWPLHARPDWLIERKKLTHSWSESVRGIREQLNSAITALPDMAEITDMLKGKCASRRGLHVCDSGYLRAHESLVMLYACADINYYQCQRILQLLEAAEQGKVKNFFGQVCGREEQEHAWPL